MIFRTRQRPPPLETVRRRLDRWRGTRAHARAPVPVRLWAAAAALVPEYGLYGTARALGVSYGGLKRHVAPQADAPRGRQAGFVELPPVPVADGDVIEIEGPAGTTVRVRLNGRPLSEVAEFTRLVVAATS